MVGGVGINLAIQEAVAAANLLARPLRERRATDDLLARVQQRREFPTRVTQRGQVAVHKRLEKVFQNSGPAIASWQLMRVTRFISIEGKSSISGLMLDQIKRVGGD